MPGELLWKAKGDQTLQRQYTACEASKGSVLREKKETAPEHSRLLPGVSMQEVCAPWLFLVPRAGGTMCSLLQMFVFLEIRWWPEKKEKSVKRERLYVTWKKEMSELMRREH